MSRINVHLEDVESQFQLYPEGSYLVEILESSKAKRSKEGNPKITWVSKIAEGEFEDKLFSWDTSLVPAALWNLKNMLEELGSLWDDDGFGMEDIFGKTLIVDVVIDKWQGQERNYVTGYHAA